MSFRQSLRPRRNGAGGAGSRQRAGSAAVDLPQYTPPVDLDVSDVDISMMGSELMGGASVSYMPPSERQRYIDGVQIKAKYVGTIEVPQPQGMQTVVTAVGRVRALHKTSGESKRKVLFIVSTSGIRILDYDSMQLRDSYNLAKISFVATLPSNRKVFAFVSVNDSFNPPIFKCHVFKSDTKALLLAETIGKCFTLAMEMKRNNEPPRAAGPAHAPMKHMPHPKHGGGGYSSSSMRPAPQRRIPPPRPPPAQRMQMPDTFDGIVHAMQRRLNPYPISNDDAVFFSAAFAELQRRHRMAVQRSKAMESEAVKAQNELASTHAKWRESLQLCNDLQHHLHESNGTGHR